MQLNLTTILTSLTSLVTASALVAADTLTITTYSDASCTHTSQSFTIGAINQCHVTSIHFQSVKISNVAQSFFNRGLKLVAYEYSDCSGVFIGINLSNNGACHENSGTAFKIAS